MRRKYTELIKLFPDRIVLVDGHLSKEAIHEHIWNELLRRELLYEEK